MTPGTSLGPREGIAVYEFDRELPVYVLAPQEEGAWPPGAASNAWLHHSLAALQGELESRGSRLLTIRASRSW